MAQTKQVAKRRSSAADVVRIYIRYRCGHTGVREIPVGTAVLVQWNTPFAECDGCKLAAGNCRKCHGTGRVWERDMQGSYAVGCSHEEEKEKVKSIPIRASWPYLS